MQFPNNSTCCGTSPYIANTNFCGCGNNYPIVPGTNPALQTWNGQAFVVADGSAQNPIRLPFLKTTQGGATYFIGADNNGNWSYYNPTNVTNANNLEVTATGSTTARTLANRFADVVNVLDFGADPTGTTSSTTAFVSAATASSGVIVPEGTYLLATSPTFPNAISFDCLAGSTISGAGAGILTKASGITREIVQTNTTGSDFATTFIRRETNHAGGTSGFVNSGLLVNSWVRNSATTNFEWAITGVVYNYANAGENVGGYFLGNKYANGPTWGGVMEVVDFSGANPTTSTIGVEIDVTGNGGDANNARVGVDVHVRQANKTISDVACTAYAAIRVNGTNSVNDVGNWTHGLIVNNATFAGIKTSNTGTYGIEVTGSTSVAIDFLSNTSSIAKLRFPRGSDCISFESTSTLTLDLAASASVLRFKNAGSEIVGMDVSATATAGLRVNAVPVVGSRKTGWSAATGTATRTTFATSSVTLSQLAERVKALIDDLISHGLIGS